MGNTNFAQGTNFEIDRTVLICITRNLRFYRPRALIETNRLAQTAFSADKYEESYVESENGVLGKIRVTYINRVDQSPSYQGLNLRADLFEIKRPAATHSVV